MDFRSVLGYLYSQKGLKFLGSIVGEAIKLHSNTKCCTRIDVARVLVKVDLQKHLHDKINLRQVSETVCSILFSYSWLPPRCVSCFKWGYIEKDCVKRHVQLLYIRTADTRTVKEIVNLVEVSEEVSGMLVKGPERVESP